MFENIWETCVSMMKMGTVVYLDLMHIYRPAAIKSMKQKRTFSTCSANVSEKVLFRKITKHKKTVFKDVYLQQGSVDLMPQTSYVCQTQKMQRKTDSLQLIKYVFRFTITRKNIQDIISITSHQGCQTGDQSVSQTTGHFQDHFQQVQYPQTSVCFLKDLEAFSSIFYCQIQVFFKKTILVVIMVTKLCVLEETYRHFRLFLWRPQVVPSPFLTLTNCEECKEQEHSVVTKEKQTSH